MDLIREVPKFSVWQFESIADYLAPFWNRGTMSFVLDEEGLGRGFCTIKLFRHLEQFLEPFVHEPCGRFGMIEAFVADGPAAIAQMARELTQRWGPQACMMWDRGTRTEEAAPRMYTWNQFVILHRRMTYGESLSTTTA
jgi:hypothetical protein